MNYIAMGVSKRRWVDGLVVEIPLSGRVSFFLKAPRDLGGLLFVFSCVLSFFVCFV